MEKKDKQLTMIRDLLNSGSISENEYREMLKVIELENAENSEDFSKSKGAVKKKSAKLVIVMSIIILFIIFGVFMLIYNARSLKRSVELSANYAIDKCYCDSTLFSEENIELNKLSRKLQIKPYLYQSDVDKALQLIEENKNEYNFSKQTLSCKAASDAAYSELLLLYPKTTNKGLLFWAKVDKLIAAKLNYVLEQENRLLKVSIDSIKFDLPFKSKSDYDFVKFSTNKFLNEFFSNLENESFDANSWFSNPVNAYLSTQNTTPREINRVISEEINIKNTYSLIPNTLIFIEKEGGINDLAVHCC